MFFQYKKSQVIFQVVFQAVFLELAPCMPIGLVSPQPVLHSYEPHCDACFNVNQTLSKESERWVQIIYASEGLRLI